MSNARRSIVNDSYNAEVRHVDDAPDRQWQASPGDPVAPKIPIYNIQITCQDGNTHLNGDVSSRGLKALIEAGASILGDPKPIITPDAPTPGVLPDKPSSEGTLMARTARKVWLQKRLREYDAKWEPAPDVNKGLILKHEDLSASVIRYEGDIFHWSIGDKDRVDWADMTEEHTAQWGTGALGEGMVAGMAEGMIEASEALIKLLDERAADANKRLGGEENGS